MIGPEQIRKAITSIAAVKGVAFDADLLADDAFLLKYAFTTTEDYEAAVQSTVRALTLLVDGRVSTSPLVDDYDGWTSYHYQHRVGQGVKADMRIMYRRAGDMVQVRGFGHRRLPADFYKRMSGAGRNAQPGQRSARC